MIVSSCCNLMTRCRSGFHSASCHVTNKHTDEHTNKLSKKQAGHAIQDCSKATMHAAHAESHNNIRNMIRWKHSWHRANWFMTGHDWAEENMLSEDGAVSTSLWSNSCVNIVLHCCTTNSKTLDITCHGMLWCCFELVWLLSMAVKCWQLLWNTHVNNMNTLIWYDDSRMQAW